MERKCERVGVIVSEALVVTFNRFIMICFEIIVISFYFIWLNKKTRIYKDAFCCQVGVFVCLFYVDKICSQIDAETEK